MPCEAEALRGVYPERSESSYLKHARNADAAFFWIPAFAGMTSCPPFYFAQDRLRRASSVRSVSETRYYLLVAFPVDGGDGWPVGAGAVAAGGGG